ncbi:MAG: hypothetical protein IRY92_00025, partial [Dactylosporangium sp.]|nr:hypothetical protein [Dactylosporangium sp.]
MSNNHVPGPFRSDLPRARARDYIAEIDAAIDAVVDARGPVAVSGGTSATRRILFVTAGGNEPRASGWLPFRAEPGELRADGDVLRVGLGPGPVTVEDARRAAAVAGARLPPGGTAIEPPEGRPDLIPALVDGLATGYTGTDPVTLHVAPSSRAAAERGLLAADVVRLARLLVNAPANVLTPAAAAEIARRIAGRADLGCTVLSPRQIVKRGLGALAAVGAGSINGPYLVHLEYPGVPNAGA